MTNEGTGALMAMNEENIGDVVSQALADTLAVLSGEAKAAYAEWVKEIAPMILAYVARKRAGDPRAQEFIDHLIAQSKAKAYLLEMSEEDAATATSQQVAISVAMTVATILI